MSQPVLETIRALLQFKNGCTIPEIATTAGLSRRHVLDVINTNEPYVQRNRKTGKVLGLVLRQPLGDQLWKSGKFYRIESYGAWSHEGDQITFEGNEDLRQQLLRSRITGGLGDSWTIKIIEATPENIEAVEAAGLRPWSEAVIDDRLWKEEHDG